MNRRLSFRQYRNLDLFFFAVLLVFSETLIVTAAVRWFPGQPFTVSPAAAVTAIVLMRWGPWAALHAVLSGAVYCAAAGGTGPQFLIYCAGNLLSLLSLGLLRLIGSETIRGDALLTMLFGACTQLFMQLGRAAVAAALGTGFVGCLDFLTTDALSTLFTVVILWISRHLDGVFENQKNYLLRQQEARERLMK